MAMITDCSRCVRKNILKKKQKYLTRIFHNDRNEEIAKADGARRTMKSDDGCVCTHCLRKTSRSTQHPSDIPASAVDRYEICGLAPLFYIDREKEATKSDENGKVSLSSQGCMSTCFLSQNTSPTKHSSDISASIDDRYELSVLDANPLVYHLRAGRSCSTVNLKFYSKYYPVGNVRGIIALHKRDFNPLLHITIK